MPCQFQKAVERGAIGVKEPWEESDDDGTVTFAIVKTVSPSVCYGVQLRGLQAGRGTGPMQKQWNF